MATTIFKESAEELAKNGIKMMAAAVNKILQQQKLLVLAIPGGRSVQPLWKLLGDEESIEWGKVHIFMVDERIVPITSDDSNYKLAYGAFLKKLVDAGKLPKENLHPFIPNNSNDYGSSSYYNELKKFNGKPDIIILGAGEDGHVGALYPNHHSVKNDSEGYIAMDDSPKPPAQRMTMSRKTILAAKIALLLFVGEGKREAYEKFKSGNDVFECPARIAKKIKDSYVLTNLQ